MLEEFYIQKSDLPPAEDLSGYVLKTEFDALKEENDNLKTQIAEINNKLANIYIKEETDNKYLSKENVVNEENYSRTDINIGGILKNVFWFTELSSSEDLHVGFVFNHYDTSTQTDPVPVITHKYSFVERIDDSEPYDYYLNEERTIRIFIRDKRGRTGPSGQYIYTFKLFDVATNAEIIKYLLKEWYLETGYKFDSYNVYYKEMIDEKFSV